MSDKERAWESVWESERRISTERELEGKSERSESLDLRSESFVPIRDHFPLKDTVLGIESSRD